MCEPVTIEPPGFTAGEHAPDVAHGIATHDQPRLLAPAGVLVGRGHPLGRVDGPPHTRFAVRAERGEFHDIALDQGSIDLDSLTTHQ